MTVAKECLATGRHEAALEPDPARRLLVGRDRRVEDLVRVRHVHDGDVDPALVALGRLAEPRGRRGTLATDDDLSPSRDDGDGVRRQILIRRAGEERAIRCVGGAAGQVVELWVAEHDEVSRDAGIDRCAGIDDVDPIRGSHNEYGPPVGEIGGRHPSLVGHRERPEIGLEGRGDPGVDERVADAHEGRDEGAEADRDPPGQGVHETDDAMRAPYHRSMAFPIEPPIEPMLAKPTPEIPDGEGGSTSRSGTGSGPSSSGTGPRSTSSAATSSR